MKTQEHIELLDKLGACGEARQWATKFASAQEAWDACPRGDWMLWLLGRISGNPGSDSRKKVVMAACECARLALPQYEIAYPDDKRPRTAIETAESHCADNATLKEVKNAASAAAHAAYTAYAAYAAHTAYAAASAAAHTAYAAYAAHTAYAAASAAARSTRLKECAEIVRKHFPKAPEVK